MGEPSDQPPQLRVAIVSDDLSGAADAGAGFLRAGLTVTVSRHPHLRTPSSSSVVAYSMHSRDLPEALVTGRIDAACAALATRNPQEIVKKVDSTLRGHLDLELRLLLERLRPELVVVAPAFPAQGRQVIGGELLVGGARHGPSVAAAFALDDTCPVVGLDTVRSARLNELFRNSEHAVVVCDTEDEEDLDRVAKSGLASGRRLLWVGSAGLALGLASALGRVETDTAPTWPSTSKRPILLAVASQNPVTRRQLERLRLAGGCTTLEIDAGVLAAGAAPPAALRDALVRDLDTERDVLLAVEGAIAPGAEAAIERSLAALVAEHRSRLGGLVLCGGSTAEAVLYACEVEHFTLVGEVEAGIPIGYVAEQDLSIVTKAGGFGDENGLVTCLETLRAHRPSTDRR